MEILYRNARIRKQFSPEHVRGWKYPERVKTGLLSIQNALAQATCLNDIVRMPQYHFHRLEGKRRKEWSLRVGNTGYRITLVPCDGNGDEMTSGDILSQSRSIGAVLITEVSNHYE